MWESRIVQKSFGQHVRADVRLPVTNAKGHGEAQAPPLGVDVMQTPEVSPCSWDSTEPWFRFEARTVFHEVVVSELITRHFALKQGWLGNEQRLGRPC